MPIIMLLPITKDEQVFWKHYKQNISKFWGINKKSNTTSVCGKCQALSPDMPIIVLPSIIRE